MARYIIDYWYQVQGGVIQNVGQEDFGGNWPRPYPPQDDGYYPTAVEAPSEELAQYYDHATGNPVWNDAEQRVDAQWSPALYREEMDRRIQRQRIDAEVSNVDLRADSGRTVLMDEANAEAERQTNRLTATADADLDAFDPTFDVQQIGSIATAASLYAQEQRTLNEDASLTTAQIADLEAARNAHYQVVQAGDDGAEVPAVPDSVRLKVGTVAEGFGSLKVRRIEEAGFWWLEFELRTDRELSVRDYWIAVYSEGTYLTTPQLTDTGDQEHYVADRLAVNLPHTPPKQYEYTLCHQHISNQQFEPVVLAADANEAIALIRWGGNASGAAPGGQAGGAGATWEDTGQTVNYVGANLVRIGSTAGFAVNDVIRFNNRPETFVVTSVHSSIDLVLDAQPDVAVVGDAVFKQS